MRNTLLTAILFVMATGSAAGVEESTAGIASTYAQHTRGVELARAGKYQEGLDVLLPLLQRFPDDYPLQRDVILITIWKGDCADALQRFRRLRNHPGLEPYLVIPVSGCLRAANRPMESQVLLQRALADHPDSKPLQDAMLQANVAQRLDRGIVREGWLLSLSLAMDESDQGLREWIGRAEGAAYVTESTQVYANYLLTRSSDSQYSLADQDRLGAGVRHDFGLQWQIDQRFSADLGVSGRAGSSTYLRYRPADDWSLEAGYDSWADDIPIRARINDIEARHWTGAAEYNSTNYRWYWRLAANGYDFSDTNARRDLFTIAGYAYEMLAQREQRIFVEWYQSNNTLDTAPYFNPASDRSIGLVQRTDFVMQSRYKRHVDHLILMLSAYRQEGYATRTRWGVRYEQDYDFDENNALQIGAGYNRNVYDGARESITRLDISYRRRF
jgi:hypothetical protein